ncbi:MAG: collagen-binding protein [Melioribacteraceae bacterium]|nr:MAG: collagen-binding protein [Melioribacteraceae bacterium]
MKRLIAAIFLLVSFSISAQQTGSINGKAIDKTTLEPLPGVNIIVLNTNFGASTDLNGNFIIENIPAGTYVLRASFIGYNNIVKSEVVVNTARPTNVEFLMTSAVIELEGVTIQSDFFETNPTELTSVKKFSYEEIRRAPGGFEDVVRALSILPGVAQQSAGRNDLVVRGGAPSENLYVIDGLVVPNINHFGSQGATGGPLSFINLDFVKETTFSTGGFSAAYGDKLSSVLKIDLREGRTDRLGGKATISASQFGLNLEGPIANSGSYIFSVRRSYLDFIFNAAGFNFVPEYYDALAKVNYDLDTKNKISFLYVGAFDNVKFNNNDEEDIYDNARILGSDQITYVTGLSYRHLFNNGFYTLSLSRNFTDFDSFQRDTLLNPIFNNISREQENTLKADLIYKLSNKSELNFGLSTTLVKFDADVFFPSNFVTTFGETLPLNQVVREEIYNKSAAYAQYSNLVYDRLRYTLGARVDFFDIVETKFSFSPRLSLAYKLSPLTTLSASVGLYHQSPSYIWLAAFDSNRNLKPVRVTQYVAGIEHLLRDDTRIKLEGFYKTYNDYPASTIRPYLVLANTGAGFGGAENNFASFGLEPLVSVGEGFARGIEFSAQKKSSDVPHYALFSLTYSESYYTGLDGVERPGGYDQRWIANLSGGYIFNEKWEASFKFRFATGNPYTPYESDGTQLVSNYLTERFKPLHSLDVRVDRRWNFDGWALITYLDIQNIYNNKNSNSQSWDFKEQKVEEGQSIGLLPSIGISLEF